MKIVADENIPLVNEFFQDMGDIVRLPGRQMSAVDLNNADVLLVRSVTPVGAELLSKSQVQFVGTCTIGIDHLDQHFLSANNIAYASAPGCNANAVVEYVYAALCHLNVDWRPLRFGIIGCGNVGGLLYRRLRQQGVECVCYDPFLTGESCPDLASLEDVLTCDVISMHTPLTLAGPYPSFHMIGAAELSRLKSGAVLLNCGRGAAIDNKALLETLLVRDDLRIVLDVWEPEPRISLPLLDRVSLGTPHIAGYSYDGKLKGTEMIYQALCRHLNLQPEKSLNDLVPPLENNSLNVSDADDWSAVKYLIPEVYNIAADNNNLRELAVQSHLNKMDFALGFDQLRKHYPVRREFHNYVLSDARTSHQHSWLSTLGFNFQ